MTQDCQLLYLNLTNLSSTEVFKIAASQEKLTANKRLLIVLILAFGLVNGLLYITLIPKWQAPDEPRYFGEIRTVAEDHKIPGITADKEIDHPPLYYIVATPFYWLGSIWGENGSVLMIRLFGLSQLLIVALLTFLIAREIFPSNTFVHYGAPLLIILNPQLVFITGSIQSDVILNTFCALLFYQGVLLVKRGLSIKRVLFIAIIVTGGIYAKERFAIILASFSLLVALIAVRWLWSKIRTYESPKSSLFKTNMGAIVALFSLFSISATLSYRTSVFSTFSDYLIKGINASSSLDFRSRIFKQYWGTFGWFDLPLNDHLYVILDYLALFAVAGIIASIIGYVLRHDEERDVKKSRIKNLLSITKKIRTDTLIILVFFISSIALIYSAIGYYDTFGAGSGGRYIFIVSVPLAILMAYGISRLVPKGFDNAALTALFSGFFLFNLVVIYNYLVPFYY